ncbi:MAG TPA: hypothetical protein VNW29_01915 [Candidatus Sulfotelmatobacter sp.]|jgi:hypothetical protein|nr:hypothetical protein [Candidatus Sulfotelmatobacter sp.]
MENKSSQNQNPFVRQSAAQSSTSAASVPVVNSLSSAKPVMQSMTPPKHGVSGLVIMLVLLVMIAFGIGSGYGAALFSANTGTSLFPNALNPNAPIKGKVYGNGDTSVFKDTTEGILQNGGLAGEGQYHLVRPGGASQNVYLTSATVDLSQFINQKVKVWGATQAAKKAGWLMDVGKIQVE